MKLPNWIKKTVTYDKKGKKHIALDIETSPLEFKQVNVDAIEDVVQGRVWITKKGEELPYSLIGDDHLKNILSLMAENPHWRKDQYKPLLQEQIKRQQREMAKASPAGKILYG